MQALLRSGGFLDALLLARASACGGEAGAGAATGFSSASLPSPSSPLPCDRLIRPLLVGAGWVDHAVALLGMWSSALAGQVSCVGGPEGDCACGPDTDTGAVLCGADPLPPPTVAAAIESDGCAAAAACTPAALRARLFSVIFFYLLVLGFIMPTMAVYAAERRSRMAFLRGNGLLPEPAPTTTAVQLEQPLTMRPLAAAAAAAEEQAAAAGMQAAVPSPALRDELSLAAATTVIALAVALCSTCIWEALRLFAGGSAASGALVC